MAHKVIVTEGSNSYGDYLIFEIDLYRKKDANRIATIDRLKNPIDGMDGYRYFWDGRLVKVYTDLEEAKREVLEDIKDFFSEADGDTEIKVIN